ncbi:MAG: phosphatidate cytidylyltransferase [Rhodobacteraceae bacterium]|nr:phosphatidate cytidylyltransferase [Paracoccaceae bacterium]
MLALIAGGGDLPRQVVASQKARPLVCVLDGAQPEGVKADRTFRLETLGSLLAELQDAGVDRVCFVGDVARPRFDPSALDAATMPLVPRFQAALAQGDNGALEVVRDIFREAGFAVLGVHELLPDLLARPGVLSRAEPDEQMRRDAARGAQVLAALSALDIGQACVVGRAQVVGVEAIGGTDHMLATLPAVARSAKAILCKGPKRGQIREIDLPTIGPRTVQNACDAGLAGIVLDAAGVLLLERDTCVALADRHGLVLWVREEPAP